jgi:response regulator RpfG family c-di-GMP phosphodiesterase/DNA-binding SARP family transcriptional activator
MQMNILLLDDDPLITKGLAKALKREGYTVFTADRPSRAIEIASEELIDLLVCDVRMPETDGLEALGSLRQLQGGMRSIIITGYASDDAPIRAVKSGVDDYLLKPFPTDVFLKSVRHSLALRKLEKRNQTDSESLKRRFLQLVATLVNLFLSRDTHFRDHVLKVASLATDLGVEMGLKEEALDRLELAALLHDVGLATVDRELLLKSEPLDEAERILLTQKPQAAARKILSGVADLTSVIHIIEHARENFDGSGHPKGLREENIPIESRILRVAEAFDSLTSSRPQREAFTAEAAICQLEEESGTNFDPGVVALCAALAQENRTLTDPAKLFSRSSGAGNRQERVESLLTLAGLLSESGTVEEANKAYQQAEELLSQDSETELQIALNIGKAQTALRAGSNAQAARWAAAAKHALQSEGHRTARLVLDLCRIYLNVGRKDVAAEILTWCPTPDPLEEERSRLALRLAYVAGDGEAFLAQFGEWWENGSAIVGLSPADAREACGILLGALRSPKLETEAQNGLASLVGRYPHLRPLVVSRLPDTADDSFLPKAERGEDTTANETRQSVLEIRLLGALQVRLGNSMVPPKGWTTRKARELFALLAYHGRPVAASRLEELLWPHGGDKVRTNLHTTVSRVRRALRQAAGEEHTVLQSDGDFYLLNADISSWCDVRDFESLAQQVTQGSEEGELSRTREQAALKCLSLYQGDFLEGIWEEWTFQPRTNLRETWFSVQTRLAAHYLAQGNHKAADNCCGEMLSREPCREEAHLGLIQSALTQGRRDQAVMLYHKYVDILKKEMNLEPSVDVKRLYLEVIDQAES